MLLTTVESIRSNLGFDDMVDVNAAIEAALHSAETMLSSSIRTKFGREEHEDVFFVHTSDFRYYGNRCDLLLNQGFVQEAGFTVERSVTSDFSDVEDVTSSYRVDWEKGVLIDTKNRYERHFVRVSYTAGFSADTVDATSYLLTEVPTWLQEMAKMQALILLEKHPVMENTGVRQGVAMLATTLSIMAQQYVRYVPQAIKPNL